MNPLFETVTDLNQSRDKIRSRRYGVIKVVDERFQQIQFRPWPKMISVAEATWMGGWQHKRQRRNQCMLYYNQPMGHSGFLALKYIVSTSGTSYGTFRGALVILDEIARLKNINAIVAEVTNGRISDRFLQRIGWEQHLENKKARHFIKRFYGNYPDHRHEKILNDVDVYRVDDLFEQTHAVDSSNA